MAKKKELTVEEKLRALYNLQLIDSRVDEIRNVRGELPLEVRDLEDEVEGFKLRYQKLEDNLNEIDNQIKSKKNLIEEAKVLIKKYNEQQKNVRNNREFIAEEVLGEVNNQFARFHYSVYDIGAGGGNDFKIFVGLTGQEHTYVSGGTVTFGGTTVNVTNFVYDNICFFFSTPIFFSRRTSFIC